MAKAIALGTKLLIENDEDPAEFVAVGNLTSIGVPGPEKGEVDSTDFDSEAVESLPTLPDNGEFEFAGNLNEGDAGQALAFADANDADAPVRNMKIQFTRQDVEYLFTGWVKRFRPTAPGPQQLYTFTGSIRVSGAVTKGAIA